MKGDPESKLLIDKLRAGHDRSGFDCGDPPLNDWLSRFAWVNERADSSRTYVALSEDDRIAAYYALAAGSVHKHESPRRIAQGLADHPVGVILLARLAVDRAQQGKGVGKALLFDALDRIASAAEIVAARAVLVHAIDESARRFYLHFGFEESPVDRYQLLLLMKDLRRAIR
jgi:GNAT superfamily N-acetyltransferase